MSGLYPAKRKAPETHTTEFDVLKASHKFLRSAGEDTAKSWEAQLAKKYEDTLFKEFAICDLKHYKSGNVALRWRTEHEVLSGVGEETCGNKRCSYHDLQNESITTTPGHSKDANKTDPKLTTLELPFSYVEQGETEARQVMVKVVLCDRCAKKLMWKREKDKEKRPDASKQKPSEKKPEQGSSNFNEIAKQRLKEKSRENSRRSSDGNRSRSKSPRRPHRKPY